MSFFPVPVLKTVSDLRYWLQGEMFPQLAETVDLSSERQLVAVPEFASPEGHCDDKMAVEIHDRCEPELFADRESRD